MTQPNSAQKIDDFKFAIVVRIEGRNCRAIIVRVAGIAAALITIALKVVVVLMRLYSHH